MDPANHAQEESKVFPSRRAIESSLTLTTPHPSPEIEVRQESAESTAPQSSRPKSESDTHSRSSTFDLSMYEDLDPSEPVYQLLLNSNIGFKPCHLPVPREPTSEMLYVSNGPDFTSRPAYWPYERPYREGDFREAICRNRRRSPGDVSQIFV
ncbi:hypothetical protein DL770_009999 [Monosporascus sp. CRB-9-2]|nr:hypothetical protein DL770_009999 [Monosporascus sp. CRB-9-2]